MRLKKKNIKIYQGDRINELYLFKCYINVTIFMSELGMWINNNPSSTFLRFSIKIAKKLPKHYPFSATLRKGTEMSEKYGFWFAFFWRRFTLLYVSTKQFFIFC